jgi:hypothetical protein
MARKRTRKLSQKAKESEEKKTLENLTAEKEGE